VAPGAPDDLSAAPTTQAWLATSSDPAALVSRQYFFRQRLMDPNPAARDIEKQQDLLDQCAKISGVSLG
jgi:hypothetical protein